MVSPLVLKTVIGKYDNTRPFRQGFTGSDRIRLDLVEYDPLPPAFRLMVRDLAFDVCEMAMATHALAFRYNKPITALPIGLWRHFHHGNLLCAANSQLRGPADLAGGRIGVRSYAQTTGVWLRGILQHQYGIDTSAITWVTLEDAHVDEYEDPPNAVRAAPGKGLKDMLLAGEVDAVMGLRKFDPAGFRPVMADPDAEAAAWYRKTGVLPLNHLLTVRTELLDQHPWLREEIMALFTKAKEQAHRDAPEPTPLMRMVGGDPHPYGVEENRAAIQMLLDFCAEQKLTPRAYGVDEIFAR